jgi:hypothetical protein
LPLALHEIDAAPANADLLEATTWLVLALAKRDAETPLNGTLASLQERLLALPITERQSLSHLLLMHAISMWSNPTGPDVEKISRRISNLRALPTE